MTSTSIGQMLIDVQAEDADLRSLLSTFTSNLRESAGSTDTSSCRQRLDDFATKFSELLSKRNALIAFSKTSPENPPVPDLASKLPASRQSMRAYMQQLDTISRSLSTTVDLCNQGLQARKHVPDPKDILTLAHRIRQTSFQGLGVNPSEPPCPQLWHMHISAISAFNAQHEAAAAQTHQTADSAQPSSSAPGRRPKKAIPPPPPGWKPGDPIPDLPNTDSSSDEDDEGMEEAEEEEEAGYAAGGALPELGFAYALNPDLNADIDELEDMEVVSDEEFSDDDDED